jgi:hypothetical protein
MALSSSSVSSNFSSLRSQSFDHSFQNALVSTLAPSLVRAPLSTRSTQARAEAKTIGWVYNISAGYKFSFSAANQLQLGYEKVIKPLLNSTNVDYALVADVLVTKQFEYLCQLLKAGTCKTIYFDAAFSQYQFSIIRQLQVTTSTELVNARLSYMFANKQQA